MSKEIGRKHENQAIDILKRIYGGGVSRVQVNKSGHDPFRMVDIMCAKPQLPVLFVQVKTNGVSPKTFRKYASRAKLRIDNKHCKFQIWNRVDRNGWYIHEFNGESFDQKLYIDKCNTSDAREQFATYWGKMY